MGSHDAPAIAAALVNAGRSAETPVAIVENASMPDARVHYTTLAALPGFQSDSGGPTLLLVGPQFRARGAQYVEAAIPDRVAAVAGR